MIGKIESKVQVKLKYDEEGLGKEKEILPVYILLFTSLKGKY